MADDIRIRIFPEDIKRMQERYSKKLVDKAALVVSKYSAKVVRDAKKIISSEGYRDTGRLINTIHPSLAVYADRIVGEVNAGTKYARFIHEGAEHVSDTAVKPHFVPFKAAPGLLTWAKRHEVVVQKRGKWHFKGKKTGKEYAIDINKGGLMVMTRRTLFFEKPFEAEKDKFIGELSRLAGGSSDND